MFQISHVVKVNSILIDSKEKSGIVVGEDQNEIQIAPIVDDIEPYKSEKESLPINGNDLVIGELAQSGLVRPHKTFWAEKSASKIIGKARSEFVDNVLRLQSKFLINSYYTFAHKPDQLAFVPGQSTVPVSGKVFGAEEMQNLVESALDFWLTAGRFNDAFEKRLATLLGIQYALTTNS